MKKLIPAFALLLVSAVLMSTASFAWFSMNNTVTVTGMEIRTVVGDNLLIAGDTLASTAKKADSNFSNSLVQTIDALVEPASTVDGKAFFYTANNNVYATGDAINEEYVAYNAAGFNTNYGTTGAVGYVDYVFQLKAINGAAASEIRLTKLDLTYGGATDPGKAYRVAMFVEDITSGTATADAGNLVTIFTASGAANFTPTKAVKYISDAAAETALGAGAKALQDVTYCANTSTAKISVAANETKYYKVVIRLWLEGEDTTCNNATYMALSDKWSLDLQFSLVAASAAASAVQNIGLHTTTAPKTVLTVGTDNGDASGVVTINGVNYYPTTKTLGSDTLYIGGNATLAADSHIYTIATVYPTDVTNQVSIVNPAP